MATRTSKPAWSPEDLLPPLPPEGLELDALIKAMVAEADADTRPRVPMEQVFADLRVHHAKRIARGS
jgi:hypothetical protein